MSIVTRECLGAQGKVRGKLMEENMLHYERKQKTVELTRQILQVTNDLMRQRENTPPT